MTKFKRVARYDMKIAEEGKWFPVLDEFDVEHGAFKCVFFEIGSPAWQAANERAVRDTKNKKGFRQAPKLNKREAAKEEDRETVRNFVDHVLIDWRGIEDEHGKPVKFSREAALSYFDLEDPTALYVFRRLMHLTGDVRQFQPDEQGGELPEGN